MNTSKMWLFVNAVVYFSDNNKMVFSSHEFHKILEWQLIKRLKFMISLIKTKKETPSVGVPFLLLGIGKLVLN